jgi:hypothetical protein
VGFVIVVVVIPLAVVVLIPIIVVIRSCSLSLSSFVVMVVVVVVVLVVLSLFVIVHRRSCHAGVVVLWGILLSLSPRGLHSFGVAIVVVVVVVLPCSLSWHDVVGVVFAVLVFAFWGCVIPVIVFVIVVPVVPPHCPPHFFHHPRCLHLHGPRLRAMVVVLGWFVAWLMWPHCLPLLLFIHRRRCRCKWW